jgi:hypothetical protein
MTADEARKAHSDLVAALAVANADNRLWWYSWLSSRDVYNSRLPALLEDPSLPLPSLNLRTLAAELVGLWRGWHASRSLDQPKADLVFLTLFEKRSASTAGAGYQDAYFGDLPLRLARQGLNVLVTGQINGQMDEILPLLPKERELALRPLQAWLRPADMAIGMKDALNGLLTMRPAGSRPLWSLARADLMMTLPAALRCLVLERALVRLLKANPDCRLLHPCENNPWERMAIQASRRLSPRRPRVVGYVHNPILPENRKITASAAEWSIRPDPDVILCTGPAAAEALASLGGYPRERLAVACDLRLPADSGIRQETGSPVRTILVLLSGLPSTAQQLSWLHEAASFLPTGVRILLRGHPNRPVSDLAARAGVPLPPNPAARLEVSTEPQLAEVLAKADMVVYRSSGTVFAAARLGIPLLYHAAESPEGGDPLFHRTDLRRQVIAPADLAQAITNLEGQSLKVRHMAAQARADYAQSCMSAPSAEHLEQFITA